LATDLDAAGLLCQNPTTPWRYYAVPENVFDKASRFAAKLDPPRFLNWLLGMPLDAFTFRGWLDTRGVPFPGDADQISDTVAVSTILPNTECRGPSRSSFRSNLTR